MFEEQVCIPYTHTELEKELCSLKDGKASGYEKIANELLKHKGFKFKLYLKIFLNKVFGDGIVPQDLNIGKCMLVHKVWIIYRLQMLTITPAQGGKCKKNSIKDSEYILRISRCTG